MTSSDFQPEDYSRYSHTQLQAFIRQSERALLKRPSERFQLLTRAAPFKPLANPRKDDWIYFGGHLIPIDDLIGSAISFGRSRSGKTLQLEPFLVSVIAAIGRGKQRGMGRRLINYDAKLSMLPFFHHYCQKYNVPLYYFNLSDTRSITFNFAKDLEGRSDYFQEFSKVVIPTPETGEPFWAYVAQALSHAGLLGLQELFGDQWGLHHYYSLALASMTQLETMLSVTKYGRLVKERFLPDDQAKNTIFGFISQLSSSLKQIEVAAEQQYDCAQQSKNYFLSVKELLEDNAVLLISTDIDLRQTTDKIVQLVTRNLVNHIGNKPDNSDYPYDRTFVGIDEFPVWGKLFGIDELTSFTPSKGSFTYLVAQDISQMHQRYGKDHTQTITGNCQWQLYFSPASAASAQFYAEKLGTYKFRQINQQISYSGGSLTRSLGFHEQKEELVLPGELRQLLPPATPQQGSRFLVDLPVWDNPYLQHLSPEQIEQRKPQKSAIPDRVPRPIRTFPVDQMITADERYAISQRLNKKQVFEKFMEAVQGLPDPIKTQMELTYRHLANFTREDAVKVQQMTHDR